MSNRHLMRSIALQSLFEWDFKDKVEDIDEFIEYDIDSFAPSIKKENDFLQFITKGVVRNAKKIDKIVKKFAPEWPINQISIVDRNILRIGIFELLYNHSVPYKVVINEAIELAKNFSSENSSKFINGVLGSVILEIYKNTSDVYEIGLVIKNSDNKFLVINNDKNDIVKIENLFRKKIEEINNLNLIEEIKKEKSDREKRKQDKEKGIKEPPIPAAILETENKESTEIVQEVKDELEEKEEKTNEKINYLENKEFIEILKTNLNNLFGLDKFKLKEVGEANYSKTEDNEDDELFFKIIKKNIYLIVVDDFEKITIPPENYKWLDKDGFIESISHKNIQKIIKDII